MSASIESLLKADQRDNSVPDEKQAQEFIEICRSGDVKQVAERLKVSPSLANVCNAAGLSVLMCVIKGKKKQRDDDDDEEEEEEDENDAKRRLEIVKELIKYGADINTQVIKEGPHKGETALWCAASFSRGFVFDHLLELGPRDVNSYPVATENELGKTTLWYVSHPGIVENFYVQNSFRIRRLLELGATNLDNCPVIGGEKGKTALRLVAEGGDYASFRLLLAKGASLELPGNPKINRNAFLETVSWRLKEFKSTLFQEVHRVKSSFDAAVALFEYAESPDVDEDDLEKALFELDSAVNGRINGKTALQVALEKGNVIVIEALVGLLAKGIDVLLPEWKEAVAQLELKPSTMGILRGFGKLQTLEKILHDLEVSQAPVKEGKESQEAKELKESKDQSEKYGEILRLTEQIVKCSKEIEDLQIRSKLCYQLGERLDQAMKKGLAVVSEQALIDIFGCVSREKQTPTFYEISRERMAFYILASGKPPARRISNGQPSLLGEDEEVINPGIFRARLACEAGIAMPPQDVCHAIVQAGMGPAAEGLYPSNLMERGIEREDEADSDHYGLALERGFDFIQETIADLKKKMEAQQREIDEQREKEAARLKEVARLQGELASLKAQLASSQASSASSISSASLSASVSSSVSSFEDPKEKREAQVLAEASLEDSSSSKTELLTCYNGRRKRKDRDNSQKSSALQPDNNYKLSKLS